ncbi:MAG: response regulator [Acidobacteria bacterium]|nr:response regulator [Acidobacteriota bacterium]
MRIMIVDDAEAMRRYIRRIADLAGTGVNEYIEVENGAVALQQLREQAVDVILTDIHMPVMDGRELIAQVMADPALSRIPIVVISTDNTRTSMREMVALGAMGYVEKPFSPERLGLELQRVIAVADELARIE